MTPQRMITVSEDAARVTAPIMWGDMRSESTPTARREITEVAARPSEGFERARRGEELTIDGSEKSTAHRSRQSQRRREYGQVKGRKEEAKRLHNVRNLKCPEALALPPGLGSSRRMFASRGSRCGSDGDSRLESWHGRCEENSGENGLGHTSQLTFQVARRRNVRVPVE